MIPDPPFPPRAPRFSTTTPEAHTLLHQRCVPSRFASCLGTLPIQQRTTRSGINTNQPRPGRMRTAATLQRIQHRELGTNMTAKFSHRLAFTAAQALAWAISLARPISMHTDSEGVRHPNVFAQPLYGSPWWRVDLWRPEAGCIEARIFGCAVEVFYVPKTAALA